MLKYPGHTLMGDVAYMKPYEKENVPYLLALRDGYSRNLSVYPLESLKSSDVDRILNEFLNTSIYKYEKNFTDEAVEFTSKLAKKMLKKNIKFTCILRFPKQ